MDGVHIYNLDILAGYGTPNLLEKKHLNKLILRYTDSNSLSVESLLIIALADPSTRRDNSICMTNQTPYAWRGPALQP